MWRKRGETITTGYDRKPLDQEELTLTCWGRNHKVLSDLLQTAVDEEYKKNKSTDLTIWVRAAQSWMGGWEKAVTKKRRDLNTVVLDVHLKAELVSDAKKFINEPEYYADLGIPYRRGYLLYGPPGNGKTSFCQALAGELNLDICMLNLSDSSLDDNSLAGSLRDAPANAIILIEDIDAAFVGRDDAVGVGGAKGSSSGGGGRRSSGGISFSGLLNAIDGAASQEGRILIMTTNHKEKLDPALIRPGRADFHREIRNATKDQAMSMFERFFAELEGRQDVQAASVRFGARFPDSGDISMAMLQGFLQAHRGARSRHWVCRMYCAQWVVAAQTTDQPPNAQALSNVIQVWMAWTRPACGYLAWARTTRIRRVGA
jgi:chaperone BCS1